MLPIRQLLVALFVFILCRHAGTSMAQEPAKSSEPSSDESVSDTFDSDAAQAENRLVDEMKKLRLSRRELLLENNALRAMLDGDYASARKSYDAAIGLPGSEHSPDLYADRGSANFMAGDFKGAYNDSNKSLQILEYMQNQRLAIIENTPNKNLDRNAYKTLIANAYFGRGSASNELGHYDDALADFNKALALAPQARILRKKSQALIALKRYQEAADAYSEAVKQDPKIKQPRDAKIICAVLQQGGQHISACE